MYFSDWDLINCKHSQFDYTRPVHDYIVVNLPKQTTLLSVKVDPEKEQIFDPVS